MERLQLVLVVRRADHRRRARARVSDGARAAGVARGVRAAAAAAAPLPAQECHAARPPPALLQTARPIAPVHLPRLRCSERYASLVHCGGIAYLFTRAAVGDMRRWRTLVRARAASAAEAAFGEPTVAFDDALAMSHNAGFACDADGSTLLAYGGLGNWAFDTAPNGRAEPGVYRTNAAATLPPLQWTPPVLAVTGNKTETGCREERAGWERCEYDGKISVARFRGRVWLYLRANMIGGGGARHAEATSSRDGIGGWSRHVPIEVDGYAAGRRENNLYFFAVQRLRRRGDAAAAKARLVAAFPAVFHRAGRRLPEHERRRAALVAARARLPIGCAR